jgi:two-component system, cell cycle sensor histidine kinase and response regulator CckA
MPTIDFEHFFDLSSDLLCVLSEEGRFVRANAAFERVLGWTPHSLEGRDFVSLVHDRDAATTSQRVAHPASGGSGDFSVHIRHADGTFRQVRWLTSRADNGTQLFAAGTIVDDGMTTDPEELAEDILGELSDYVSDFVWVREADSGKILYRNDAWERITGQMVPVGAHYSEFFKSTHPEDLDRAKQAGQMMQGGYDQLIRAIDRNGAVRWMRVRTFPVHNSAGELWRVVGVLEDVTELKQTEEALQNSELRLRSLLESSSDLIMLIDGQGRFTYLNPSFATTLGFPVEEWLNRSGFELVWPDDVPAARETLTQVLQLTPDIVVPWQLRARSADGSWRWLEGTTTNHLNDPAIRGIVVNCRDVTDRKRLEGQFRQAQKMESIGRLAGGIAHDFNNLLTAIKGNLELAMMEIQPIDPRFEYLADADKAADSATSLTRQLLTFSRKQVIDPKVINLNDVLTHVQKLLARLIGEDVTLENFVEPELSSVRFDPSQVEQILINLAVNARDAMPNGGRLTLETANVDLDDEYVKSHPYVEAGPYVMLAVSDTGAGMTDTVRAHLFEPFFTTKDAGRGTGLGLAMVYGAVKQNGGQIEVYSEPGHGTTFKIYLPALDQAPGTALEPSTERRPAGTESIVLVEDEGHVRTIASRMLARLGYTVHAFGDGPSAIAAVTQMTEVPPLLITDVVMPGMNGQVLMERLLELRPSIKVLFTSGYTANVIVHHGVLREGIEFLAKPYSLDLLAQRVREVLDK